MTTQKPSVWTALRCREPEFQACLGVSSEAAAAAKVRELCEVTSRSELDRDAAAEARWHERIRRRFLRYQQARASSAQQ
ncbi:hypothetical protein IP91_00086 [Pseudoduganella lurida]|uniref:Uncharacterized protein n=1 Tax=Pseudoduganella lurida TaxID=1036180 RepID=A0A562RJ02_9BURK|nr:hypothetical protein [Pseudoduganella lurida]TWI69021.1 hypothetical protein IP91_00086 [Pseudoduganella lurida]